MFGLEGMRVLITGAGGGIGTALGAAFRAAGARVIAADREPGADLVFDLADAAATASALAALLAQGDAPDIVVANAGWTRAETFADLTTDSFDAELSINLSGAWRLLDPLLPAMKARGGGAITFVASVNALLHYGNPAYSAAKAGMLALMRGIAVEWGAGGIRANAVCPGSVLTPAWDHRLKRDPGLAAKVLAHYPLGRLATPQEVANAVLFLSSPLAASISGAALPVDAGLSAGNLGFFRDVLGAQ